MLVKPLLGGREALPVGKWGGQRTLLPLRMEGRILEGGELREKRIHEKRKLSIALGVGSPVIGREHRRNRNRIHLLLLLRNQVGIVLRSQGCRQVVVLQRLGVVDRYKM